MTLLSTRIRRTVIDCDVIGEQEEILGECADEVKKLEREIKELKEFVKEASTLDDWDEWPEPEDACNVIANQAKELLS